MRHYEDSALIGTKPEELFAFVDDHACLSSHMNKSSWMMGGGSMKTHADERKFQEVGSHLQMDGTVFGIKLFLDEQVTKYEPPFRKEWQTIGELNLLVIGHYKLGFEIKPENNKSKFRIYIDYDLPKSMGAGILGYLLGDMYAKWCVKQMLKNTRDYFKSNK